MAKKNNNGQRSLFNDETAPKQKNLFDALNSSKTEQSHVSEHKRVSDEIERPHNPDSELLSRLDAMSVSELETEVRKHNELYNQGKPVIADLTYDMLVQKLRDLQADSTVADELTSPDVSSVSRGKVIHHIPMLSIRKPDIRMVFDEIETWLSNFEGDVMATPKIDGLACSLVYDENGNLQLASTRGNGNVGENITANVRYINAIPKQIDAPNLEVRGEVYMPLDAFEAFEGDKISARNLAVGGLKQKDPKETAKYHLSFFAYDTVGGDFESDGMKFDALEKLGFTVPEHHIIKRNQDLRQFRLDIEAFCHTMTEQRRTWNFDADGVVFKVDDNRVQKEMGATAHHPRCAIAYKFPCMEQETTLREVRWQVAKGAAITPVAVFDTVELAGAMVQKASLSNAGMVMKFPLGKDDPEQGKKSNPVHLKLGSRLLVSRRGDVIPHVEYVVSEPENATKVEIPNICPSCGGPAKLEGLFLKCMNPDDCPATGQALIENYLKVIGCLGFGEKSIERLYDSGKVETPADLYRLTKDDIAQALSDDGFIDQNAILPGKLFDAIQNARHLSLATFLESLSIPSLGRVNSRILTEKSHSLDEVLNDDITQLREKLYKNPYENIKDALGLYYILHSIINYIDTQPNSKLTSELLNKLLIDDKYQEELLSKYSHFGDITNASQDELCKTFFYATAKNSAKTDSKKIYDLFQTAHISLITEIEPILKKAKKILYYPEFLAQLNSSNKLKITSQDELYNICFKVRIKANKDKNQKYQKDALRLYYILHSINISTNIQSDSNLTSEILETLLTDGIYHHELLNKYYYFGDLLKVSRDELCDTFFLASAKDFAFKDSQELYNIFQTKCIVEIKDIEPLLRKAQKLLYYPELLTQFNSCDELKTTSQENLYNICFKVRLEMEEKLARNIHDGLIRRRKLIDDLRQYVTIEQRKQNNEAKPFAGMTFLFTGSLEHMKREEAQARVEALGGKAATGISKTLSVLVATSQTSTKWRKAQELNESGANIALWNEEQFLATLEDAEKGE